MSWRELLQTEDETTVLPWVGGRSLCSSDRQWKINGRLPREHGWFKWEIQARTAKCKSREELNPDILAFRETGYLVGDRFIQDNARVNPDPKQIFEVSEPIHLIEDGLDRFTRISAGRVYREGPLYFVQEEFPLGPEMDVQNAFLDEERSVAGIKEVPPALDAAFRMETWQRDEAEKARLEMERIRREEEEKRQKEERRQRLIEQTGDGQARRELAAIDFKEAARAALRIGNATYLDHKKARGGKKNEMVVTFRLEQRRFQCTCDAHTLRIIDAGICLIDHADNDKKYDTYLTLESLPGVIAEAIRIRRLVVFRHVG